MTGDSSTQQVLSKRIWILSCLFGIGSWVVMNGIWVELPNLVNNLPEGWKLPSYMTIIVQIANVGPILYSVLKKKCFVGREAGLQHWTILLIFMCGLIGCLLLTEFWNKTFLIFGEERSLALLLLTFLTALVDCTSSVTFLPFMSQLPASYMSPFYVGENLSSLITAIVGLSQGVEVYNGTSSEPDQGIIQEARFSQGVFFGVLAFVLFLSFASYIYLSRTTSFEYDELPDEEENVNKEQLNLTSSNGSTNRNPEMSPLLVYSQNKPTILIFFGAMFWLNALQNGIIASIGSYANGPYGELTYHLASTIGPFVSSLACFSFMFYPRTSRNDVIIGTIGYTLTSVYIVVMAAMSPHPLGYNSNFGKAAIVIIGVLSSSMVSYTKLAISSVMRSYGHRYLFYTGVVMQLGSFCGAVIMFPIVNYTNAFHS